MGQIDIKGLTEMAVDESRAESYSAAKKVLEAVMDSPDLPRPQGALPISDPLLQRQ